MSRNLALDVAVLALGALAALLPSLLTVYADTDLWWHLHTGLRILDQHSLPDVDDLSFTAAGDPWVDHEWGAEVIFALAYRALGGPGLTILRAALLAVATAGLVTLVWRRWRHLAGTLLAAFLAVPFLAGFLNVRAHAFSYTLAIVYLLLLDLAGEGRRWPLLAMPALMLVWVNLHGGFLLGQVIATMGLGSLALGLEGDAASIDRRWLAGSWLAIALAGLCHPYGVSLWRYLVKELLYAEHVGISEWQPLQGLALAIAVAFAIVPLVLSALAERLRARPTQLAFFLIGAAATWRSGRFFPLVVVFGALVAADALGALWPRLEVGRDLIAALRRRSVAMALAGALLMPSSFAFGRDLARKGLDLEVDTDIVPVAAVRWLKSRELGPNLANHFQWGGYLIWHLSDTYRVAVDGRSAMVYSDAFIGEYITAYEDGSLPKRTPNADAWLVESSGPTFDVLDADPVWHLAYLDWQAAVFARRGTTVHGPTGVTEELVTFP